MPIPFTCPHCGAETTVADEYAGQQGPCATCGKTITVPAAMGPVGGPMPRKSATPIILVVVAVSGVVVLFCGGILIALLLPAIQAAREAARRATCINNLHQISIAMMLYEQENGCFPPAYIADENGTPMHSWRVLLLPYLEQRSLYNMYDFDEPWNGPNNIQLAGMIQSVYTCPSDSSSSGTGDTNYVMVVGPGTISDGPTPTQISQIADGTSFTIMLVEVDNSGIAWTEPRDLDATELALGIKPGGNVGVRSAHPQVANVLFCDGSVHSLDSSISPQELIDMSTIAGGEDIDPLFSY